ncbi:MAG: gliding motility-associated C-terminal domain-containing protein [Bacteroidota bacterium]
MRIFFYISLLLLPSGVKSQCSGTEPVIDLGEDTVLCSGQALNLSVPAGYDLYSWSTGNSGTSLNVLAGGTYIVEATLFIGNANLVTNGNFENGSSGFSSDYQHVQFASPTALWDPGYYAVGSSPTDYHSNFYNCTDHTSGSGKMYIANGSSSPNTIIWSQTITVQPNTNYNFSAWAASVENTGVPALLQFFVNGSQIGNIFSPSTSGCIWNEFYNLWNSGTNTSAVISIVNQNTEASGNDFALDDISFIPYCTNSDSITVTVESISVDAGPDQTICADSSVSLTAVSTHPNTAFTWNTSATGPGLQPQESGTYTVTGTTPGACTDSDVVNVTINPLPNASFSASASEIQIPQSISFEAAELSNSVYNWVVNGSPEGNSPVFSYLFTEAGQYTINLSLISEEGCLSDYALTIEAFDESSLETANIFTPNQDGDNDTYHFNMQNIKSIDLLIFNRWGQEVCHILETSQEWDGKDPEGKDLSAGIYFYRYSALTGTGEKTLSGQGFIHLVR